MTAPRSALTRSALLVSAIALAASCSSSSTISRSDVEKKAATQLAAAVKSKVKPNIDCPRDLDAKKGATMDCQLSVTGDPTHYPVHVKVTSVKDGDYHMTFVVGTTPSK